MFRLYKNHQGAYSMCLWCFFWPCILV